MSGTSRGSSRRARSTTGKASIGRGDDWIDPFLDAYAKVQPNLVKHDAAFPTAEQLRAITLLGNVAAEGEMTKVTAGSTLIVERLLDASDPRPIWLQAWGGTNTIARALKTIEEEHPTRMAEVAGKLRFFLIWEQDGTYQSYIRPKWGSFDIPTIISDQFWALAYDWPKIVPQDMQTYLKAAWMEPNILSGHGPLASMYPDANNQFRSEGDSPAFTHMIDTGLRSMESPSHGGWGGRYIKIRQNTWMDAVPVAGYQHPSGRWYQSSAWGARYMADTYPNQQDLMRRYYEPLTRWTGVMQNDFAARADWSVKSYADANHPPVVVLASGLDLSVKAGQTVALSAEGTSDPDGDGLTYRWWQYGDADSYGQAITIQGGNAKEATFQVPGDAKAGDTIHVICEVRDDGSPALTRYRRVIATVVP